MYIIFKNFLTTLRRFKASSILNILGLAVAFASFYIIVTQVRWELTYNKGIPDSDRVYMVEIKSWMDASKFSAFLNRPLTEKCLANSPQIEYGGLLTWNGQDNIVIKKGASVNPYSVYYCESTVSTLKALGFKTITGELKQLSEPKTVIISQSVSALTGCGVNDIIYMGNETSADAARRVVAVYKDFPKNSVMGNNGVVCDIGRQNIDNWSTWNYCVYVKLHNGVNAKQFEEQWAHTVREYFEEQERENLAKGEEKSTAEDMDKSVERYKIRLSNIADTYFEEDLEGLGVIGNKTTTYTLLAIAVLMVLIALINFINFFFALVPLRIKAVNTFKIFGSMPVQLRANFIFEAFGLLVIGLIFAAFFVYIFSGSSIASFVSGSLNPVENIFVFCATILSAIAVALTASIYPAYYITSFPPALVVKGSFGTSKSGRSLRTLLICVQFIISIIFIISTLFVKLQHSYMLKYDMGFNKENLMVTKITKKIAEMNIRESYTAKLLENPQIKAVTYAEGPIVAQNRMGWGRGFKDGQISFQSYPVSWDFLNFMGIEVTEGRNFQKSDQLDSASCLIFNEQAKKEFGLTLGDKINTFSQESPIVGFCDDFKFKPLNFGVSPFAFVVDGVGSWQQPTYTYLRVAAGADIEAVKKHIIETDIQFDPSVLKDQVTITFFDEELGRNYEAERRLAMLITVFAVLSILISLMGVFGLVLFDTQFRKREIAIRKVHGATVGSILELFNTKYVKIVLGCFIVATPLGWYIMSRWTATFAYRTRLYWWVFAAALLIVMIITILTVTARSFKAATENPADSVKE
jgi:putative ABC transport system permease protein